jgi:uncharacterized protein YdeI (YjbR/CyaY-like superfamily)
MLMAKHTLLTERADNPTVRFRSQAVWEAWLEKHHAGSTGLWIKFARKISGTPSLTHPEALDVALCFGWIDGQKASLNDGFWLQRFTPRRPRSKWSQINCRKALALQEGGRLRSAGVREIEAAKADGRWQAAYAPQRTIEVPDDLRAVLKARPKARKKFEGRDSKNRYAILYRIQDAKKPETRARRIQKYVDLLLSGETIY